MIAPIASCRYTSDPLKALNGTPTRAGCTDFRGHQGYTYGHPGDCSTSQKEIVNSRLATLGDQGMTSVHTARKTPIMIQSRLVSPDPSLAIANKPVFVIFLAFSLTGKLVPQLIDCQILIPLVGPVNSIDLPQ